MNRNVPSVSDLVGSIKKNLEGSFRNVTVIGEITNLSLSSAGHWYLSLSDQNSLIGAAIFRMDALRNPIVKNLKDGDKVMCAGSISVYPKRGTFQLIVKRITPVGAGDLKAKFEQLKKRLAADGLFDLTHKLPIPEIPRRIAVITALRGAALSDFLNIMKRRSHFCDILVCPAVVQGAAAPNSIRKALENIIRLDMKYRESKQEDKYFDVIVLTRGGGSLEDLWAFNDEALAWDIFNCPIPTISAVGHQVDYSISDFVSDLRCETPSAAAEILTNGQKLLLDRLSSNRRHLKGAMHSIYQKSQMNLATSSPVKILEKIWRKYGVYNSKLESLNLIKRKNELIPNQQYQYELDQKLDSLKRAMQQAISNRHQNIDKNHDLLQALNPKNILNRGYAYTEVKGRVISNARDFNKLESLEIVNLHYADGSVEVLKK